MVSKLIELKNIEKVYKLKNDKVQALKSLNLTIEQGDFLMIMGKSGSGKTTLLNILGLLDSFDGGKYNFMGEDLINLDENKKSEIRNKYMGFIFQQFHLIESLNVASNVELPLLYGEHISSQERKKRVEKYIDLVGLIDKKNMLPSELSGGQQQRIAIARALINNPYVIFADEPTGALDSENGEAIMNILKSMNEENKTIVMVTHDEDLVRYANKVIYIKDGVITKVDEKCPL
ncbi:MAG: ABC transporter ATP-binding protein [Clostridium sp.]